MPQNNTTNTLNNLRTKQVTTKIKKNNGSKILIDTERVAVPSEPESKKEEKKEKRSLRQLFKDYVIDNRPAFLRRNREERLLHNKYKKLDTKLKSAETLKAFDAYSQTKTKLVNELKIKLEVFKKNLEREFKLCPSSEDQINILKKYRKYQSTARKEFYLSLIKLNQKLVQEIYPDLNEVSEDITTKVLDALEITNSKRTLETLDEKSRKKQLEQLTPTEKDTIVKISTEKAMISRTTAIDTELESSINEKEVSILLKPRQKKLEKLLEDRNKFIKSKLDEIKSKLKNNQYTKAGLKEEITALKQALKEKEQQVVALFKDITPSQQAFYVYEKALEKIPNSISEKQLALIDALTTIEKENFPTKNKSKKKHPKVGVFIDKERLDNMPETFRGLFFEKTTYDYVFRSTKGKKKQLRDGDALMMIIHGGYRQDNIPDIIAENSSRNSHVVAARCNTSVFQACKIAQRTGVNLHFLPHSTSNGTPIPNTRIEHRESSMFGLFGSTPKARTETPLGDLIPTTELHTASQTDYGIIYRPYCQDPQNTFLRTNPDNTLLSFGRKTEKSHNKNIQFLQGIFTVLGFNFSKNKKKIEKPRIFDSGMIEWAMQQEQREEQAKEQEKRQEQGSSITSKQEETHEKVQNLDKPAHGLQRQQSKGESTTRSSRRLGRKTAIS